MKSLWVSNSEERNRTGLSSLCASMVHANELTDETNTDGYELVILELSDGGFSDNLALFIRLKDLFASLPIVVVGTDDNCEAAIEFMRNGAADYLSAVELNETRTPFRLRLILERHNARDSKYARTALFNLLLDRSFDGFLLLDSNLQVSYCNKMGLQTFGWKSVEAIGKHLSEIIPQHLRSQVFRKLRIRNSDSNYLAFTMTETLAEHSSGKTFPVELGMVEVNGHHDNTRYAVLIRNISKQEQTKEELERLVHERTKMLIQNNEELKQFAKVASHDLQEPLRAIQGFAELLSNSTKGKLDQDCVEFIDFILDGIDRMSQLIQSILAHAQVNNIDCSEHPTDCNSVLTEVLKDLQDSLNLAQANLEIEQLPEVAVERSQMVQLFQNLISNSVKYHSTKPLMITISAQKTVNDWLFSVRDNGIGIEPQYTEKVFDMFSRLHSKGKYPGTGIGLAICKRIVTLNGGNIWVESNLGQGSIFMFTLPVVKEKEKTNAREAEHFIGR